MTTATLPSSTGIVSTYSYDNADRLTGIAHVQNGSTTIASVAYTLDAVGNRTQRVDQQGTHTYAYDNLYRLTSVTYPGPTTTSYAFDAFGNRTNMTDSSGTTAYAYDDAERLTSVTPPSPQPVVNYTWDNNGDLTARGSDSFAWDYEDRMTSATVGGTTTTFTYRGDGLRNSRTTGGVTTTFTWDINAGLPVVLDDLSERPLRGCQQAVRVWSVRGRVASRLMPCVPQALSGRRQPRSPASALGSRQPVHRSGDPSVRPFRGCDRSGDKRTQASFTGAGWWCTRLLKLISTR